MNTIVTKLVITAAGIALLASCTVGPDFKRPEPPQADRYTVEKQSEPKNPDAVAAQHIVIGESPGPQWWQVFQSDTLNQVVQRALAGNRTLTAASWSVAQAQELANARAGTVWPTVDLTSGIGRQKYGAQFLGTLPKPPPFSYFAVGASVSYTLDYTGGIGRSIEQQRALNEYHQHQADAAGLAVTGNAITLALRIAALNAQIATVDELLDRDRENLKLIELAFNAGSVSRLDVVSAQSQLASDATVLPPLRQELSTVRHALAVIVGAAPTMSDLPDIDLAQLVLPSNLPLNVPSELARRRPDILSAESQLHAATAAVGIATSNLYPHIDLTGSIGQQAVTLETLFDKSSNVWSLAAGLVAPVFDGGTLRAEKRASVDAMRASAANYEQTVLAAFGQVADSLDALEHGAEQLQAQAHAEDAAREYVELTRKSYGEGNGDVLQVLDAERRYQQARLGFVRAQAQRYLDTVQLFLALGGAGPST
jgi:NodT family efflux transporter outer membrane factor (OMF) lipoprotein